MSYMNGFSGGHGGHHGGHHGGGHGGGFFSPMMIGPTSYPWYQEPSTIEIITTGDDVCIACRAGTVKGPACDKCPGIKYAGVGADVGWGTAAGSLAAVAVLGGLIWYLSRGKRRSPRRRRHVRRHRRISRRRVSRQLRFRPA